MRERHRHAVASQQHRNVESLKQPGQLVAEQLPAMIRLGTTHHEVRRPVGVARQMQVERRLVDRRPVVAVEHHDGTARPVVVDEIHAEGPEQLGLGMLQQGLDQRRADAPRVDETVEEVEQRGP